MSRPDKRRECVNCGGALIYLGSPCINCDLIHRWCPDCGSLLMEYDDWTGREVVDVIKPKLMEKKQ
jgi:ribosomal protein S27AE